MINPGTCIKALFWSHVFCKQLINDKNLKRAKEAHKAQYNLTIPERQIRIYKLNNCKAKSEGNEYWMYEGHAKTELKV